MPTLTTSRPLSEAVATLSRKTPVGAALSSREWALVPAEIRLRAMFSAMVEREHLLAEMQGRLQARIELAKKDGRTMDRGVFIEELRAELEADGYRRGDAKRGSLRDLKSSRRLGLIWDMNIAQVQGYARWKAGMNPDALEAAPAQELIRGRQRLEIRDWPLIWADHGGKFYGAPGPDYPAAPGRMIALKTDPIWRFISRFNSPWSPYDWGSGMVEKSIRRRESDALGVTSPDDTFEPLSTPFNESVEASVAGISADRRRAIEDALTGEVEIIDDRIRLVPMEPMPEIFVLPSRPAPLAVHAPKVKQVVAKLAETDRAAILQPIRSTVAWQRLKVAAEASGETLSDEETLERALIQYYATEAGGAADIRDARREPVRDAWWTALDFLGIFAAIAAVLGGGQ